MQRILLALVGGGLAAGCGRFGFGDYDPAGGGDAAILDGDAAPLAPWSTPTLVPLPTIGNDDDPTMTSDLLELYFDRDGDILVATRTAVGAPWTSPAILAELSSAALETQPELSVDGLEMYFASDRAGGAGGVDIWYSQRVDRGSAWGAPAHVAALSSALDDWGGAQTADRTLMSVVRDPNNFDLYLAARASPTDPWSPPQPIAALATTATEDEPFLTGDGLALYYSATGPTGNPDLFVTVRASRTDPFGKGAAIGELASNVADRDAWVSADARYIVFGSARGAGPSTLWEASR